MVDDVTDTDALGFSGAIRVHPLFLAEVDDGEFSEGHTANWLAFEVGVDGAGWIDSPVDGAYVRDFDGEAEAGIAFEVADEAAYLGPVVFIRSLIRLERKARAVRSLRRDRVTRKRIYTTVPLNICACFSERGRRVSLSQTVKRYSPAGVLAVLLRSSGNLSMTLRVYFSMLKVILPMVE